MPTKRFWLVCGLGILIAILGSFGSSGAGERYGVTYINPVWVFNLLIVVVAYITGQMQKPERGLKISRHFDTVLSARCENRIELTLENENNFDIAFRLRDEPPANFVCDRREFQSTLQVGSITTFAYLATPPERGDDYFQGTFIRFRCPLGLVERQVFFPTQEPVRVYPNVLALREFQLLNQRGRLREIGLRKAKMRGLGTEFESLRDYALGDDFRKIDWKATARRDRLIVRQFEIERNQTVLIAIDIGRHMLGEIGGVTKLDITLDAALMLARAALLEGDQVGVMVYSDRVARFVPPGKNRNQMGVIVEAVHDLVATPVESDPVAAFSYLASRWKRRSLLVHFTDAGDGDRAKRMAIAMLPMIRRHLCLVARVSDPMIREVIQKPLVTNVDLYSKAAGLMIDEDRIRASLIFASSGLRYVESEPQDLAAALVNYYFNVKDRGLI